MKIVKCFFATNSFLFTMLATSNSFASDPSNTCSISEKVSAQRMEQNFPVTASSKIEADGRLLNYHVTVSFTPRSAARDEIDVVVGIKDKASTVVTFNFGYISKNNNSYTTIILPDNHSSFDVTCEFNKF